MRREHLRTGAWRGPRRGWTAAALILVSISLLGAGVAQARWFRAESAHYVVYGRGGEAKLDAYVQELEAFDALLRAHHGVAADASPTKLTVVLLPDHELLRQINPKINPTVNGFYSASPEQIVDVDGPAGATAASPMMTVFHEYTHHFVAQYFTGFYPAWINEGLAVYFGATRLEKDRIELGQDDPVRRYLLQNRGWMPIETVINQKFDLSNDPNQAMFYPESWIAIHYLMQNAELRAQLTNYIFAVRRGEPPSTAFPRVFGMSCSEFQKKLLTYTYHMKYLVEKRPADAKAAVTTTPLPDSADRLFLLSLHLRSGAVDDADRSWLLDQAREAANDFPDDALALNVLARAEMNFGDMDRSDSALDHLLAAHPDDVEALYLKGRRLVMAGERDPARRDALWAQARPWFAKARQRDPTFFPAVYLDAMTHADEAGGPAAETVAEFLTAHELAPQVGVISVNTARTLIRARRYADAVAVLEPIAYEPHAGQQTGAARKLLERARTLLTQAAGTPPATP